MRAWLAGGLAALRAPLWLRQDRLRSLLAPPLPGAAGRRRADPAPALRAGRFALRILARLPRSPWRNTCLFRSVMACQVLRDAGYPVALRIGVKQDEGDGGAAAHAWVHGDAEALAHLAPERLDGLVELTSGTAAGAARKAGSP